MIRRSTWILLGIFAIALLGAWYLERTPVRAQSSQETATPTDLPSVLSGWTEQEITQMDVTTAKGDGVNLTRQNNQWILTTKPESALDQGRVVEMITELTAMKTVSALDSVPDLKDLGLAPASATVIVTTSQDQKKTLLIGELTPTGSGYYARVDANPPVIVSSGSVDRILELASSDALLSNPPTPAASAAPGTPLAP